MKRAGFTIIELLITISIIGLLLGLLVTNMDRSLSKNRLANDVDLMKSKLEEVRLMAASTQSQDEQSVSPNAATDIGYYGLFIPSSENAFYLIKLPTDTTTLPTNFITDKKYIVEKVSLSSGVKITQRTDQAVIYKVPAQQIYSLSIVSSKWTTGSPTYNSPFVTMTYQDKTAVVNISDYLGKVEVTYQ